MTYVHTADHNYWICIWERYGGNDLKGTANVTNLRTGYVNWPEPELVRFRRRYHPYRTEDGQIVLQIIYFVKTQCDLMDNEGAGARARQRTPSSYLPIRLPP